jgi:hypothetical protein
VPWWAPALALGTLLAVLAAFLRDRGVFLLAAAAIVAGLVGVGWQLYRERTRPEDDEEETVGPPVHRRAACRVERSLVDRLIRQVEVLRQRAEEKGWEADWDTYRRFHEEGDDLLRRDGAAGDLDGAFRAYCLALLPLTTALNKHRHKEEAFTPVWDKSR